MAQIIFKGKSIIWNHHLGVKYHQLIPQKDKSVSKKLSLHDNLIVHGDNLKALKALLPTYSGRVKCIYIDPPYNTGNENWAYNDNVSHPMFADWLKKTVDKDDLTKHDKWLCMMTPRLKLLRELLSEDGVIIISIDDNELASLTLLLDEIYNDGHLATFVWRKRIGSSMSNDWISSDHEYLLVYSKNREIVKILGDEKDMSKYNMPDINGRFFASMPLTVGMNKNMRPNQWYELINPKTGTGYWPTRGRTWGFYPPTMKKKIQDDLIIWPEDYPERKLTTPRLKSYPEDSKRKRKPTTTWLDNIARTEDGSKELKQIFGESPFSYPKPTKLIKHLINQFAFEKDPIILDSFAGSGTTAQAVLELNKEDGGNRKFILVEMEDYADSITAERVRRVIKKGLPGTFSYFDLGDAIEMEEILSGKNLPSYKELARYVFYTATGEEFDDSKVDETKNFIGESRDYQIYLFYKPDLNYLKSTALTLDLAKSIGVPNGKQRLVFAPTKFVDQDTLDYLHISFAQLPFEIYKLAK